MDDFTHADNQQQQTVAIPAGKEAVFVMQPGFVEGILPEEKHVAAIEEAFRFIFRDTREYGIITWNGIPVRFSYTEDLPFMIKPVLKLLSELQQETGTKDRSMTINTSNLNLQWEITQTPTQQLTIRQICTRITGNYQAALNEQNTITIPTAEFLSEWKLLLAQLEEAWQRSGLSLAVPEEHDVLNRLEQLNRHITRRGTLYNY